MYHIGASGPNVAKCVMIFMIFPKKNHENHEIHDSADLWINLHRIRHFNASLTLQQQQDWKGYNVNNLHDTCTHGTVYTSGCVRVSACLRARHAEDHNTIFNYGHLC